MQQDLLDLEILIAEKAAKIRQNILDVYFEDKSRQYYEEFIDSDGSNLQEIHTKVKALHELMDDINSMIESGKLAEHTTGE